MNNLDKFGELIAINMRDSALNHCLSIEAGTLKSTGCKELTKELSGFSESQVRVVKRLLNECIETGIHDFLFSLEEAHGEIKVLVNGEDVVSKSDGLQGEPFTADGWFERYSEHKEKGI